jgi:chromosome segregation ATPase
MTETIIKGTKKIPLLNSLLSIVLAVITATGVGYGFYFNTNNKLDRHDQQIQTLETNVNRLQEAIQLNNTNLAVQSNELKNISKSINKLEQGQLQIIKLLKP